MEWLVGAGVAGLVAGVLGTRAATAATATVQASRGGRRLRRFGKLPLAAKIAVYAAAVAIVASTTAILAIQRSDTPHAAPTSVPPASTVGPKPISDVVTVDGRVGPFQFGVATEADIRRALGTPGAIASGRIAPDPTFAPYLMLGYSCSILKSGTAFLVGVESDHSARYCQTAYLINTNTRTLRGFETVSRNFETASGTRVGMRIAEAEQRERRAVIRGCDVGIALGDPARASQIYLAVDDRSSTVVWLGADSNEQGTGVTYCL